MTEIGIPELINGIIVDKFLIDGWPEEFKGCWISISKHADGGTNASLIKNNIEPEGSILYSNYEQDVISSIKWNKFYRFISMNTIEEYRNSGIAYLLARWARTWVAKNEGVQIQMPYPSERTDQAQNFIEDWKERYSDPTTRI